MTLPTSPAECHAPFRCAAAKKLWSSPNTADKEEELYGNQLSLVDPDFRLSYAAAQEAEYAHLLLIAMGYCYAELPTGDSLLPMEKQARDYYLAHK